MNITERNNRVAAKGIEIALVELAADTDIHCELWDGSRKELREYLAGMAGCYGAEQWGGIEDEIAEAATKIITQADLDRAREICRAVATAA